MGRELDTVSGDESAHPLQIVLELVLVKNGCGEAEVFAQEVPVEAWDLVVVKSRSNAPSPLLSGQWARRDQLKWLLHRSSNLQMLGFARDWAQTRSAYSYILNERPCRVATR